MKVNKKDFYNPLKKIDALTLTNLEHYMKEIIDFAGTGAGQELLKKGLYDGDISDDKIKITKRSITCDKLQPSQNNIFLDKMVGMAQGYEPMTIGIKTGVIDGSSITVSKDNYVIDGHHRWATAMLFNPKASLKQVQTINLKIDRALVYLTAALRANGASNQGKSGDSNYNIFGLNDYKTFTKRLTECVNKNAKKEGVEYNEFDVTSPMSQFCEWYTKEILKKKKINDLEENVSFVIDTLYANLQRIQTPESYMPDRSYMPQVDDVVLDTMASGKVDVLSPFFAESLAPKNLLRRLFLD